MQLYTGRHADYHDGLARGWLAPRVLPACAALTESAALPRLRRLELNQL